MPCRPGLTAPPHPLQPGPAQSLLQHGARPGEPCKARWTEGVGAPRPLTIGVRGQPGCQTHQCSIVQIQAGRCIFGSHDTFKKQHEGTLIDWEFHFQMFPGFPGIYRRIGYLGTQPHPPHTVGQSGHPGGWQSPWLPRASPPSSGLSGHPASGPRSGVSWALGTTTPCLSRGAPPASQTHLGVGGVVARRPGQQLQT